MVNSVNVNFSLKKNANKSFAREKGKMFIVE